MILASFLLGALSVMQTSEPMPSWVMPGIAQIETSSTYIAGADDVLKWRNRYMGADGELGAFQMTWDEVKAAGGSKMDFVMLTNSKCAVYWCRRRLKQLCSSTGTWERAVEAWNCGVRGRRTNPERAADYLRRVRKAGGVK
jgi:hypothetical protein